jgi:hypothetical protein
LVNYVIRITFAFMEGKKYSEKRQVRSYKIVDKFYFKAQKRAAKEKTTVANVIETCLMHYAEGNQYLSSKN